MSKQLIGLRRGIRVLELLAAEDTGMTFNGLKEAFIDLPASTVSRLLKVLVDERLVSYDAVERRYALADRTVELADMVRGTVPAARRVQPVLDRLAADTGLSAMFMEVRDGQTVIAAKAEMPDAFHYGPVGACPSGNAHGMRQLCCAHLPPAERKKLSEPFKVQRQTLDELRTLDVFVNAADDQPGLVRICAPVFDEAGAFAGVIGVSHFQRFPDKKVREIAALVKDAAQNALQ